MKIWNRLCEKVDKKKDVSEGRFEKEIALEFLGALNWSEYYDNLKEQFQIDVHGDKWRPDFALFLEGSEDPEIIVELKKPKHKQRNKDIRQIATYMKLVDCRFGLYFGEKLELFFLDYSLEKRVAKSVLSVEFVKNDKNGKQLIDLLKSDNYSSMKMRKFCEEQLALDDVCKYWCSDEGISAIYDFIREKSNLPMLVSDRLKAAIKLSVERTSEEIKDEEATEPEKPHTSPHKANENDIYTEFCLVEPEKGTDAKMHYYPSGNRYVILKGSKVTVKETKDCTGEAKRYREQVLGDSTKARRDGKVFILLQDCVIMPKKEAPNVSAQFCTGRSTNARTTWKTEGGAKTFNDVFPKAANTSQKSTSSTIVRNKRKTRQNRSGNGKVMLSLDGDAFLPLRKFVLDVVQRYVRSHPNDTFGDIEAFFPKRACRIKMLITRTEWEQKPLSVYKKYFGKDDEILKDANEVEFLVSTEWTVDDVEQKILPLIEDKLGWTIYKKDSRE